MKRPEPERDFDDVGWERRQHTLEIFKVVGTLSLIFGPVGALLLWFSHSALGDHRERQISQLAEKSADSSARKKSRQPTEIYLGEFRSSSGSAQRAKESPGSQGIRVVELEISGIMRGSTDEVVHFERGLGRYQNRIRAAITEIARGATDEELRDPAMQSMRQKIRGKLNRLFGRRQFEEIVFNHFRTYDL